MTLAAVILFAVLILIVWRRQRVRRHWFDGGEPRRVCAVARPANLPEAILADRLQDFEITAIERDESAPRVYTVRAKHIGAATHKARSWGVQILRVEPADRVSLTETASAGTAWQRG
jgi:hypothetical protein